jgi:F-type H+-transporting ATPase subunit b
VSARRFTWIAGALAAASISTFALAQQPPPPSQRVPQPGQPGQAQPGHKPSPNDPDVQARIQQLLQQRMQHQQGAPGGRPPRPGGPLPIGGLPGSHARPPAHAAPHAAHAVHAEEPHHPDEEHCPGHGPDDPPPPPNWWHGMLMANTERAKEGGFVNQLLFRYENEENPCDPRNEAPPFAATVLNFAVLLLVLYKYGRKPLSDALAKRRETIMADIDTATRLKEEAEDRLAEYEESFENLSEKLEGMRREYADQSEAEKRRIVDEAEERRARMRKDAQFRIEQELKQAKADLLREAVAASAAAAEALVVARMTTDDHERIAEDYLKALGPAVKRGAAATTLGGAA